MTEDREVPRVLFAIGDLVYDHVSAQLVQLLRAAPFERRLCVLGQAGQLVDTLRQQGIMVDVPGNGRRFDLAALRGLRRLVQEYRPSAMHVWGWGPLRALPLAGFKGPVIASPCPEAARRWSLPRLFDRWLLRKARHVVACGAVEAERCRALGARPERLAVAPPVVQLPEAKEDIAEATRCILCVGRLLSRKGFSDAIWALDILRFVHPDLRLAIVGAGPDRPRLEHFAAALDATRSVDFLGAVAEEERETLLRRALVVWSPGRSETGTQVILEAMALGKPIVASRFARSAELLTDGETGLLVPAEDKAALARQTQQLLTDAALRQRLGAAARHQVRERHQPAAAIEVCSRLYQG